MSNRPRLFFMEKAPQTAYSVSIDISAWLVSETIQSLTCTAVDASTGADATAAILDTGKCTFSGGTLKPWIKGGTDGMVYLVTCLVVTTTGSQDVFCVQVQVRTPA
jgi:hypothetical protein